MVFPTLPPFEPSFNLQASNITPFTYRDGLSYLQRLERIAKYVNRVLIPWVNENYEQLAEATKADVNRLILEVNKAVVDITTEIQEAKDARDEAVSARDAAQLYAANTEELQDEAVKALLEDEYSETREAFNSLAVGPTPAGATLYVDSVNGNDDNDGLTWGKAFKTIQAAVDAIPSYGSEIVLSIGGHDVGEGVTWPRDKWPSIIRGATPTKHRQHASTGWRQATIYSSAEDEPEAYFTIPAATGGVNNRYGGLWKDLYFEGNNLAIGGTCIETHAINRMIFDNVVGRALDDKCGEVNLIVADAEGGDDNAWHSFRNISLYGMKLGELYGSNYSYIDESCSIIGQTDYARPDGPALTITGSQIRVNAHFEGWNTGILYSNSRGGMFQPVSEWVTTLVHMDNVMESIVIANSAAGAGNSDVIDEDGDGNTVIGTTHLTRGSTKNTNSFTKRGQSFKQLTAGIASPIYGSHSVRGPIGIELFPDAQDLAQMVSINAMYHDGDEWVEWSGINTNVLQLANWQGITIDAAHKKCRFYIEGQYGNAMGLAYSQLVQANGTATEVTFRAYNASNIVTHEFATTISEPAQTRGVVGSFDVNAGKVRIEIEFEFGISGTQTAEIRRFALWAPNAHTLTSGKLLKGTSDPNGNVLGTPGDVYMCLHEYTGFGIYEKASGYNTNTGWRKLARLPESLPSLGVAATDAASTQTLVNSIRSAMINAGWATS